MLVEDKHDEVLELNVGSLTVFPVELDEVVHQFHELPVFSLQLQDLLELAVEVESGES